MQWSRGVKVHQKLGWARDLSLGGASGNGDSGSGWKEDFIPRKWGPLLNITCAMKIST